MNNVEMGMSAERFRELYGSEKDVKRQMQGASSKRVGEYFEDILQSACEYYKSLHIAEIDKTPEPFRVTGKRIKNNRLVFEGIFSKRAQPDFKGTLKGGRSIVFEAKHTDDDKVLQSRVTPEQTEALINHWNMNAYCCVIVSFKLQDFFLIPFSIWQNMKEIYGRKYIKPSDVQAFKIPYENGYLKFLSCVGAGERNARI